MTRDLTEDKLPGYAKWLSWFVAVLVPIILILTSVRLLLTPAFVNIEYRTPNFPADPYGFTQQDRLHWSLIALDYLLNDEGIAFLEELEFDDGTQVYNARELKHMVDVKEVVGSALIAWYASLGAIFLLGVWAYLGKWMPAYTQGLSRGGWITVGIVAVTMVAVLIAFSVFFVFFHQVFFESGTWVFRFSDTLIRLFPQRFWRDAFIGIGLVSLVVGLVLGYAFKPRSPSQA
jgi:integral membrane protein (TIGR01906 family)